MAFQQDFTCPAPDGNFPFSEECGQNYYICIGGSAFLMVSMNKRSRCSDANLHFTQTCPGDALFDPETLSCKMPEDVSCRSKSVQFFKKRNSI